MYVANYQRVASVDLPDTRTEFYGKVAKELIVKRRSRQLDSRTARITLERQRSAILQRIAFENLTNPEFAVNSIRIDDAIKVVRDVTKCKTFEKAEAIFKEIANDTGLLSDEVPEETVRFIHLTFCEYFAAVSAATAGPSQMALLLEAYKRNATSGQVQERTRLTEVIPFSIALIQSGIDRSRVLQYVSEHANNELVGRCLLETQHYDDDIWVQYQKVEYDYLTNTERDWDIEWASRLQLLTTLIQDSTECSRFSDAVLKPVFTSDALFANLVSDDPERVLQLFQLYVSENPAAALAVAEQTGLNMVHDHPDLLIKSCLTPPFLSLAVEKCLGSASTEWRGIIAEAGLRYDVIAKQLRAMEGEHDGFYRVVGGSNIKPYTTSSFLDWCIKTSPRVDRALPLVAIYNLSPHVGKSITSCLKSCGWIIASMVALAAITLAQGLFPISVTSLPSSWIVAVVVNPPFWLTVITTMLFLILAILAAESYIRFERSVRAKLVSGSTWSPSPLIPPFLMGRRIRTAYLYATLSSWFRLGNPPFDVHNVEILPSSGRTIAALITRVRQQIHDECQVILTMNPSGSVTIEMNNGNCGTRIRVGWIVALDSLPPASIGWDPDRPSK